MGKMVLLIVLGSYLILGVIMQNNNIAANDAVDNLIGYYGHANSRHIAASGANMAVGNLFRDKTWKAGFSNVSFSSGTINVKIISDTTLGVGGVRIMSYSNYMGYKDTVVVSMNIAYFSKYLMFSNVIQGNEYYITGDTIDGPFHTNSRLNVSGSPVFKGRVTMKNGPVNLSNVFGPPKPEFWGGYEYGVNVPLPANNDQIENAAKEAGYVMNGDLHITLSGNNVIIKSPYTGKDSSIALSAFAPNGIIAVRGDIYVKGKINSSLTIAAFQESGQGNIYIEDDVGVTDDPRNNPQSTQMLGLVAEANVIISDNAANNSNVNITAAIYCAKSLVAQNYNTRPVSGYINLYGSVTQDQDGLTGQFSGGKVVHGFNINYKYDPRLLLNAPPQFPLTDRYQILSWWE